MRRRGYVTVATKSVQRPTGSAMKTPGPGPPDGLSLDFLLLFVQNLVDGLVQDRALAVTLHAPGLRLPLYHIKPPRAIRVLVHDSDLFLQERIAACEIAQGDAKQVGNGFKPLDPADDLARSDRRAWLGCKTVVHHLAQHPHGELGEPDAPQVALLPRDPAVRWTVKIVHGQPGRETRAFVV